MYKEPVIKAVTACYKEHHDALIAIKQLKPLRKCLSERYYLYPSIYFSTNTTSVLLQILNVLAVKSAKNSTIVYSDLDHPCMVKVIESAWQGKKYKLSLHKLMLEGRVSQIEKKLSEIEIKDISIFFCSHVLWNSGIVLDASKIVMNIKLRHPQAAVIVDGAQAVGNIDFNLPANEKNEIDFYIACLHKWIGLKHIVGFASISNSWISKNLSLSKLLFLNDRFSTFAGKILLIKNSDINISTYDICQLNDIMQQLVKPVKDSKKKRIDVTKHKGINEIPSRDVVFSRFKGIYSEPKILKKICRIEGISAENIARDKMLPSGQYWLRIDV